MPLFETEKISIPSTLLKDKYGWPPFSILNTISWDWQRRKDEWEVIIGDSTEGRDVKRNNATPVNTFSARGESAKTPESVSEFDPYLCELMYDWFSLPKMKILDPFAGGCVRGVVAAVKGRNYLGIDLSPMQVVYNTNQYHRIAEKYQNIQGKVQWECADSYELDKYELFNEKFDMVFTCPPYYNLEKYSKNPNDLSNAPTYEIFLEKYSKILKNSAELLNEDCFFVIVVSEVRKSSWNIEESEYIGLVPDTIKILQGIGLKYYNEIILENNIGSLPIRAPKYFDRTRKIGRHHQNILVFYKGNLSHLEEKFGKVVKE